MTDTGPGGRPLRIVLVEDEPANRQLIRAVPSRSKDARLSKADVFEAVTLSAGRQALLDRPLDLVILDVRLPDGSGLGWPGS